MKEMGIDVMILGPGCHKCQEVANIVRKVAEEHGLPAQIEKLGNIERIAEFGIIETPAVVVGGDVKCAGRVPSPDEVLAWLQKASGQGA